MYIAYFAKGGEEKRPHFLLREEKGGGGGKGTCRSMALLPKKGDT